MTPYVLYHQYRSPQNHYLNSRGDGLLCGRPLPERGAETTQARPLCPACMSAWEKIRRASMANLIAAGCRCYAPALEFTGATVVCRECGVVVKEPTP